MNNELKKLLESQFDNQLYGTLWVQLRTKMRWQISERFEWQLLRKLREELLSE